MAGVPALKPREVIAILTRLGFAEVRQIAKDVGFTIHELLKHR
jgi:predicted RNA binding protein YcfA (HicA-like mRNA interferase family)